MITVKQLKELLARYPDDAVIHAAGGSGARGLLIKHSGRVAWINASPHSTAERQEEKDLVLD